MGVCKCIVVLYVMRNTGVDPGWGSGLNEGVVQGDDKVFFVETAYKFDPQNYVKTHDTYSIRGRG